MVGYPEQRREVGSITWGEPGESQKRKPLGSHGKSVESRGGEISKITRITKFKDHRGAFCHEWDTYWHVDI